MKAESMSSCFHLLIVLWLMSSYVNFYHILVMHSLSLHFFCFSPFFPFLPILTSASMLLLEVREKSNELGILPPVFLHVVVALVLKVLL